MNTAFAFAMGQANKDQPSMVFDWIKAAHIIIDGNVNYAEAGLAGDWSYTGDVIWNSKPVKSFTYLASKWAMPQILIGDCYRDCFIMKSETEWTSSTSWPQEALDIVKKFL